MSKYYYVQECNGERFDGTRFYWARVECSEMTKKAVKECRKPHDFEYEFYTEHRSFRFFNTKRECEEYVQTKRENEPLWSGESYRSYDTNGGNVSIYYNYDKKIKRVYLEYKSQIGIADEKTIVLEFTFDGELISHAGEYYYIQYLKALETVQKYGELIMQFTTTKNDKEGA